MSIPTRDGALVVIHDDTVERTTSAPGAVCDLTLAEIQKLEAGSWFSPCFTGERIPQLGEVFELVAPTATRLNIEIKSAPVGLDVTRGVVEPATRYRKGQRLRGFIIRPASAARSAGAGS